MLFIANWKMHGGMDFIHHWAQNFTPPNTAQVVVCPPFPYLSAVRAALPATIAVGAQNIARWAEDGAHTGEVSARMLAECGCRYGLVGHSERRLLCGEDDQQCVDKIIAAAGAGLCPILCVGETQQQRDAGDTTAVIDRQLTALDGMAAEDFAAKMAVAYEPVWAIGSGKTPSANEISDIRQYIQQKLIVKMGAFGSTITLLYGGSVTPDNIAMAIQTGMGGCLVGGASLRPDVFADICACGAEAREN